MSENQVENRSFEQNMARLEQIVALLERGERQTLQEAYRSRMYRLGELHDYRRPDGTTVRAAIEGVRPAGQLILRHEDGGTHEYLFREIEFVIPGKR